jgi:hypothetical protein
MRSIIYVITPSRRNYHMLIYNYHFTGLSIRYVSDSTDKDPLGGSTDKDL